MTSIAIRISDDQAARLADLASRLQTTVEDLATVRVLELLEKPDAEFDQALRYILQKNAQLYRRLA